jgi:hypothetical protein
MKKKELREAYLKMNPLSRQQVHMNLAENEYQAEAAGQKCSAHHQEDLSEDFDNVSGFYHKLKHFISEIGEE